MESVSFKAASSAALAAKRAHTSLLRTASDASSFLIGRAASIIPPLRFPKLRTAGMRAPSLARVRAAAAFFVKSLLLVIISPIYAVYRAAARTLGRFEDVVEVRPESKRSGHADCTVVHVLRTAGWLLHLCLSSVYPLS